MRKRTTRSNCTPQPIRISNKGPYHDTKRDESTLVNFPFSNPTNFELELSEADCYQYVDEMDFFKRQHINQLIFIKDQQRIIEDLKQKNEELESLNQNLQHDKNVLRNDIEDLNDIALMKDNEIRKLSNQIKRIKKILV